MSIIRPATETIVSSVGTRALMTGRDVVRARVPDTDSVGGSCVRLDGRLGEGPLVAHGETGRHVVLEPARVDTLGEQGDGVDDDVGRDACQVYYSRIPHYATSLACLSQLFGSHVVTQMVENAVNPIVNAICGPNTAISLNRRPPKNQLHI